MDDETSLELDRRHESGACWAIPGAMLVMLLVLIAFLWNFSGFGTASPESAAGEAVSTR